MELDGMTGGRRREIARSLADWGTALEAARGAVVDQLFAIETFETAETELDKTVRALKTYADELSVLEGRRPLGSVYVSLPMNNPLYSLALYCAGPLLAGNRVVFRPSRFSDLELREILRIAPPPPELPLELYGGSGKDFINEARFDSDCLIFTGSWESVSSIRNDFSNKLVYCGPGVNPFVFMQDGEVTGGVTTLMRGRLLNSGQDCLSIERAYVHESRLAEVLDRVVQELGRVSTGTGRGDQVGPLMAPGTADHVRELMRTGHPGRSVLVAGEIGDRIVEPIVVVTNDGDPIVRAEKFAPVFVFVPFSTTDEVYQYVVKSDYFFGLTLYGDDALAGLSHPYPHVAVNDCLVQAEESDAHIPFGGRGHSGFVQEADGSRHDGPILFSVETSYPSNQEPA